MRSRDGRQAQGPALMRLVGRPLLLAVPCVGLVLGLFALASNNDLSNLRTDGPSVGANGAGATTTTARTTTSGAARIGPASTTIGAAGTPGSGIAGTGAGAGGSGTNSAGSSIGGDVPTGADGATNGTGGLVPGASAGSGLDPATTVGSGATVSSPAGAAVPAIPAGASDVTIPGDGPLSSIPGRTVFDGSQTTGSDVTADGSSNPAGVGVPTTAGSGGSLNPSGTTVPGSAAKSTPGSPTSNLASRPGSTSAVPSAARGGGIGSLVRTIAIVVALAGSAIGVAYLAGTIIQAILDLRRRSDEDDFDDGLDDPLEAIDLQPGSTGWTLERLRAELESEPDPRVAIRRAYSVVETGFGAGGGLARRRTETPLQYLERTLGTIGGNTQPMRTLTGLFLLARYSNRPINDAMRAAAIAAVVDLQMSYRQAEGVAA